MSEKYRPCNGSEGEWFISEWCERCERDALYQETQDGKDGCEIVASALAYGVDDTRYPSEWTYDEHDNPCCTAFIPIGEKCKERCKCTNDMFGGAP